MRIKAKFKFDSAKVPIITLVTKEGTAINCILDSGSENTLVNPSFVKRHKKEFKLKKTYRKMSCVGINGDIDFPLVDLKAELLIGKKTERTFDYEGVILCPLDNITANLQTKIDKSFELAALIGTDILSKFNAILDFDAETVTFEI